MENETTLQQTQKLAPTAIQAEDDDEEKITVVDFKMVTFSLAGKDYAIDIMKVKEIAKAGRFTYVPNSFSFVLGVYNLRGDIIPVVDLRLFFNIDIPEREDDKLENMIIVTVGEQTFGIVVDGIDKVVGIQKSTIQPPHPLFGDINIKYIYGVVESNNRLYILLDIDRIFGSKMAEQEEKNKEAYRRQAVRNISTFDEAPKTAALQQEKNPAPADEEYRFIVDGLKSLGKFYVTQVNEKFIRSRYTEWETERGKDKIQFQTAAESEEFLKPFWSQCTEQWWTKNLADNVYKLLPDNAAHQIVVWNPGCGKGFESYSLACLLKKRYPESKIRIYAHDIDLLNVSNAPLLTVPEPYASGWYAPYLTKKADGDFTFSQEIKDIVMFEYHDCVNTNALPVVDIIFARDVLSVLKPDAQNGLVSDFNEKLKGNGILMLGDHEVLPDTVRWTAKPVDALVLYSKK
jgi:purine-binding chemotaxis protein CheW